MVIIQFRDIVGADSQPFVKGFENCDEYFCLWSLKDERQGDPEWEKEKENEQKREWKKAIKIKIKKNKTYKKNKINKNKNI